MTPWLTYEYIERFDNILIEKLRERKYRKKHRGGNSSFFDGLFEQQLHST